MVELDPGFINSGTVVIFSPNMDGIICVANEKCWLIVPPWWKHVPWDKNIAKTAVREVEEEIGLRMTKEIGNWLDSTGKISKRPKAVYCDEFIYPDGSRGRDYLFLFRLFQKSGHRIGKHEKSAYWFTEEHLVQHLIFSLQMGWECFDFGLLPASTRWIVLRLMRDRFGV